MRHKILKISCGIAAILIITLLVTLVILFLTVFKPKDPQITTKSVFLKDYRLVFFPVVKLINFSLGIQLTIDNRNYGGFEHQNSTTYINYRGNLVAEAPVKKDYIPARAKHDMYLKVGVDADKILSDPRFRDDLDTGFLNLTSSTTLQGKINLFKIIKRKATSHEVCNITVFLQNQTSEFVCKNKLKS